MKTQTTANKGPTEDRRDDLRFNLRAKMSQMNYVDKDLKNYHYQNSASGSVLEPKVTNKNALVSCIMDNNEASAQLERLEMIKKLNNFKP